jgi:hypothetical protein
MDREVWLAKRLGQFGHVFAGLTDRDLRKQRCRDAIREGALETAIAGRAKSGEPRTFEQVFVDIFGEPL